MSLPYIHEPFTDFTKEEYKTAFQEALFYINSQLGKEYPLVIGGERITTDKKVVSSNPANKEEIVGTVAMANQEIAEKAMQVNTLISKLYILGVFSSTSDLLSN